jgi:acyl-CoA reductase-like NAD-dependent aldehyde dehydrogenase
MQERPWKLWIGGREVDGESVADIASPFDGRVVGRHAVAGAGQLEAALESAHRARREAQRTPTHLRANVLGRVAERLRSEAESVARLICLEAGKPIQFARAEAARAALTFELAAANARTFSSATPPIDVDPRGERRLGITQRFPRGVVGAITPFNFPLNLVAHKLAPAIAVGAPFVLKPAPQCPLSALQLAHWIVEAGWPAQAVNVAPCGPALAQRIVEDPRVALLSFTGSDSVGWRLKSLAGRKHVVLELGGAAPCIVDESVALEPVVRALAASAFAYGGQVCIKTQRVLVQRSRYAEFVERMAAAARATVCGDPLAEDTVVAPLIDLAAARRVESWIELARSAGAQVRCGGAREGALIRPTVLTDVPSDARVVCDEVFGPVLVVEAYDAFDEALERCNASRFGLQAGVFTCDLGRALQAHRELEYGGVIVNDTPTLRIDSLAYGGVKDSGTGREGVLDALHEYTETRVTVLRAAPGTSSSE